MFLFLFIFVFMFILAFTDIYGINNLYPLWHPKIQTLIQNYQHYASDENHDSLAHFSME